MRFWRSISLLVLALGMLALPAVAADQKAPEKKPKGSSIPNRRAWMFGFSAGAGRTRFVGSTKTLVAELRSETPTEYPLALVLRRPDWVGTRIEASKATQYRLGYAISPRMAVGFERAQWFKDFGKYSWKFNTSLISTTFYPRAGHLFVRGGAGISATSEKIPGLGRYFLQYSDRGFGIEGALGYEWDAFGHLSIAPEVSLRSMTFSSEVRAQMAAATLAMNWWF